MQTPASYTLLGMALALASLAAVGFGGVQWWYLWETTFNDRSDEPVNYGASASCVDATGAETDPQGVGLDLVLSQDPGADRITVSGLVVGGGVQQGTGVRLRLYSDNSCTPTPTHFLAGTIVSPTVDRYADVSWTISGYRLDGSENDVTGDVIAVQSPSGRVQACCTIRRLPGAAVAARLLRRAAPPPLR
ncbi:hypothetical protein FJT64_020690 [Amphibalanus amphitrite]|uniref:Uncharacterized protein n=1 Tax=Amphibalanus amphitrite TaxID=1232801 RepID=A0A6A4X109_AMPAM|nr:uncharacterized protein LOC122381791 [Amphibalanus amphitrite]KAF0308041.1 hypothetical protein FJT64_020690 [Amphibalanus amphitrite]